MANAESITEALAPFLARRDVPPAAIEICGELISEDARFRAWHEGPTESMTSGQLLQYLERYEDMVVSCESMIRDFMETHDHGALIRSLSDVKCRLVEHAKTKINIGRRVV